MEDGETIGVAALREGKEELYVTIVRGKILSSHDVGKFRLFIYEVDSMRNVTIAVVLRNT